MLERGDALLFRPDPALPFRTCPAIAGIKTAFADGYFADKSYPQDIRRVAESCP